MQNANNADNKTPWPQIFEFGDVVCRPNFEHGIIRAGTWRNVVPVAIEGRDGKYVAKILQRKHLSGRPIKLVLAMLRRLLLIDENSREWRFLKNHRRNNKLVHLLPEPLARGSVDGTPAILVEQILWQDEAINLFKFAKQANQSQKAQIIKGLDEITELFGRYHVVCNDISARNIMVSDRTGELSLVVIDGFGNNHLIPYPIFSKTLNARKIARRLNRTKKRLGLN